ncbi:hypothetical protein Q3G72_030177 [Acer saccharum]|nr:hypothetical protein Q3G72_030177 [Acer saccharum]
MTAIVTLESISITSSNSLYEVMRVDPTASMTEIKTAYRSLAKVYHPDLSVASSNGRDFIEIHNAYETLSDLAARAVYDLSLEFRHVNETGASKVVENRRPSWFLPAILESDALTVVNAIDKKEASSSEVGVSGGIRHGWGGL